MLLRSFDIVFSLLAIIFLSPLLAIVILVLLFTGEKEVFYFQYRIGKEEKPFKLLKFATMLKNSENIGTGSITVKNDSRILPFGGFLRKTKINELPQLLNILKGDMSIIGPRPLTQQTYDCYSDEIKSQIKKIRPGLSGIGSIVFRDEESLLSNKHDAINFYNEVISPYKGALEVWYSKNNGISNYFKIIFATAWLVIFPSSKLALRLFKGIPQPPEILKRKLNL